MKPYQWKAFVIGVLTGAIIGTIYNSTHGTRWAGMGISGIISVIVTAVLLFALKSEKE